MKAGLFLLVFLISCLGQPADWLDGVLDGHLLYVADDSEKSYVKPEHLPAIANGYLGMQIGSDALYISGVYVGKATDSPSHRARIPNTASVQLVAPTLHAALDLEQAVYRRRSEVRPTEKWSGSRLACSASAAVEISCTSRTDRVWVEQRWYAHRVLRHVLVHEIEVLGTEGTAVNTARVMDDHFPGEQHPSDHTHGHYSRMSAREHLDVEINAIGSDLYHSGPLNRKGQKQKVRLRPVQRYASGSDISSLASGALAAASSSTSYIRSYSQQPIAVLKLADKQGGPSADIDLQDVTQATCALGTASDASEIVRASLRGCGSEWIVRAGYVNEMELPTLDHTAVVQLTTALPADEILPIYTSGVVYPFLTIVVTSLDFPYGTTIQEMVVSAARQYELAMGVAGQGALLALHATAWRDGLWRSGVDVLGKQEVAKIVMASLYSILSFVRSDWPFGMSPGGLSTNGYNGHVFWDDESFDWPPLNLFHPSLASSVLLYRYHRLPGARTKAKSYRPRYEGAMFPWESAFSGVETCPPYAPTGEAEIHISGDVAAAFWQHFQVTGDVAWLRDIAYPVLEGIADFWMSRTLADTPGAIIEGKNGRFYFGGIPPSGKDMRSHPAPPEWPLHISGVIAATEFYHNVTDNALTNAVAKLSLDFAVKAAIVLGYREASYYHWQNASARLVVPFDPASHRHPYFADYHFDEKQAVQLLDVPMLHSMFGIDVPREVAVADTQYYLSVFEGGAAFAYSVNSIAAADIGDLAHAHSFFAKSFANFIHGPFYVWTEYPGGTGCPNFVTAAGGFLQSLTHGYAGLRLSDNSISFEPSLPDGVSKLRLRGLVFRGHRISIEYDSMLVTITAHGSADSGSGNADASQHSRTSAENLLGSAYRTVSGAGFVSSVSGAMGPGYGWSTGHGDHGHGRSSAADDEPDVDANPVSEQLLLRVAHQLAAANADASNADSSWFWWPTRNRNRMKLFDSSKVEGVDDASWEAAHQFDPADPSSTIEEMVRARPWLDTLSHLSQSVPLPGSKLVVIDVKGRRAILEPGHSITVGLQKLTISITKDLAGSGAGASSTTRQRKQ